MSGGIARGLVLAGSGAFLLYAFFSGALSSAVASLALAIRTGPAGAFPATSGKTGPAGGAALPTHKGTGGAFGPT